MEQAITRASLAALTGIGAAPTDGERDKAHMLRKNANDLFHLAMGQMNAQKHF